MSNMMQRAARLTQAPLVAVVVLRLLAIPPWWPCGASLIKLEAWRWQRRYDIYERPVGTRYRGREFRPMSL